MIKIYFRTTSRPYLWIEDDDHLEIPYELNSLTVAAIAYFVQHILEFYGHKSTRENRDWR
jgi:hypothetical protein